MGDVDDKPGQPPRATPSQGALPQEVPGPPLHSAMPYSAMGHPPPSTNPTARHLRLFLIFGGIAAIVLLLAAVGSIVLYLNLRSPTSQASSSDDVEVTPYSRFAIPRGFGREVCDSSEAASRLHRTCLYIEGSDNRTRTFTAINVIVWKLDSDTTSSSDVELFEFRADVGDLANQEYTTIADRRAIVGYYRMPGLTFDPISKAHSIFSKDIRIDVFCVGERVNQTVQSGCSELLGTLEVLV